MTAPRSRVTAAAVLPDLPTILRGERMVLRPLRPGDSAALARHTADRRLAEATRSIPHPLPPGAAEGFVASALDPRRDEDVWAMETAQDDSPDHAALKGGQLVGLISLKPLGGGQSQVGYWVAPAFWNAGLASEAVRLLVDANPHRARTLFAEVFQDNLPSARVLTNAGFVYIGDAEAHSVARGANVPTWTYLRPMA
jgi:RimJ/RimL family protein N-acetyltransferase